MKESTRSAAVVPVAIVEEAWREVGASFERFCLTAGIVHKARNITERLAKPLHASARKALRQAGNSMMPRRRKS
jgi:hypothetical protein